MQQKSPIDSRLIQLLKYVDSFIYSTTGYENIIGGDIYDFSENGLFKFILEKFKNCDDKFIEIRFVHQKLNVIYDADMARMILEDKSVIRGNMYNRLTEFFGSGIFTSKRVELWRHQRNSILQLFMRSNLEPLLPKLIDSMFVEFDKIISEDNEIDLVSTLSIIGIVGFCEVFFGVDIRDFSRELIEPLNDLLTYINGAVEPFVMPFDKKHDDFIKMRNVVHHYLDEIITRAMASENCHPIIRNELTSTTMSHKEVIEFVLSIVLGGHETTARMLLGAIYSICQDSNIINRLNSETTTYMESHDNYHVDIIDLPYLKNVISESTRLFPPVWLSGRKCQDNINIMDIHFDKDSQFLISPLIYLRDKRIWGSDSEIFNPDRHDNLNQHQQDNMIPFIVGSMKCPGKMFALLETSCVISRLFKNYELEILQQDIYPFSAGTFRLTNKLLVRVKSLVN